jgi:hypothetical protein
LASLLASTIHRFCAVRPHCASTTVRVGTEAGL